MRQGFTLAEVLITLGIIGIVAAMTLPSIIQKRQRVATATALKKFYSAFQNSINLSQLDHGPYQNWDVSMGYNDTEALYEWFDEYIIRYMNLLRNCHTTDNRECFKTYTYCTFPGNCYSINSLSPYQIIYIFRDGSAITAITGGGTGFENRVFHIRFDTNGSRKPNVLGQDIFSFRYRNGKLSCDNHKSITGGSVSVSDSRTVLLEACKNNPQTCTCLIMSDGWEIKDDYPW